MRTNEEILKILLTSIKSKGFTEKDCLLSTSINTSFLTDWKKGRLKTPSYDKIIKLAQYLDISLDFLFLRIDENTPLTISDDEAEWLNIYKEIPIEGRPYLLAMVKTLIQNLPKEKNRSVKNQQTSTNTGENAASLDDDSNIA